MAKYRKKPVVVEAHQWFVNGDHPEDGDGKHPKDWWLYEGLIVRYWRHPNINGSSKCEQCNFKMAVHGYIDTLEDGHRVCPGDWIITGIAGEHYPCKPDIFEQTYEAV